MEIVKIKIENFKSFDSEEIFINKHINHFIGINGAGKSNFLKAIEFFGNEETDFEKNAKDTKKNINISIELKLNHSDVKNLVTKVIHHWLNFCNSFLNSLEENIINLDPDKTNFLTEKVKLFEWSVFADAFKSIYDDKERIKKWQKKPIIENNFILEILNSFENENLIISKEILITDKNIFKIFSTAKNDIFEQIIFEFSDIFIIHSIEKLIINGNESSALNWPAVFDIYKSEYNSSDPFYFLNFKQRFMIDLRSLINIFVWNKKQIDFDQDIISLEDKSQNTFLNNLLRIVDLNTEKLSSFDEHDNSLDRKQSELSEKINSLISNNWEYFKDEKLILSFKLTNKFIKMLFYNDGEHNQRSVKIESDGVKQFLSIILSLNFSQNNINTILIIDEPEIHLHPSGVISLRNMLNNSSKNYLNFFIATHSVQMIDKDNLETLNLVTKVNQNTKIINIVENEEKMEMPDILKQAFGTDIFSEFLFKKYTFFVEGKSDKVFFEKVIQEYNISANILIYYGSRGIDFIESIKGNFYQDYFENNCFFISDGDKEGIDFQDKLKDKFKNIKSFTLSEMMNSKEPLVIENFYSENLLNKYEKGKKKISENWKTKDKQPGTEKNIKNRNRKNHYDKPLMELKIKLSEEVQKNIMFEEISDKGNIEKLIAFLKEQGIITT